MVVVVVVVVVVEVVVVMVVVVVVVPTYSGKYAPPPALNRVKGYLVNMMFFF